MPRGTFEPVTGMAGGVQLGEWTDDTSMALCLATSLVWRRGFDPVDQMNRYCNSRSVGYRRIRVFLRRKGFELSWSRTHRLWRQAGLLVARKRPRKRIASVRPRIHTPFKANMVWAYDFVFDTTASGQQIKCLTVVDEYARECLAIDVAGAIRSKRVIEVLSRLVSLHGAPLFTRSDNGPEFVSQVILEWIAHAGIATVPNDPGKPWQNGPDESFNGKFRDECQSIEWFRSRREAAVLIEAWRNHYNEARPHSSLQYLTPAEFKLELRKELQPAVFQEKLSRLNRAGHRRPRQVSSWFELN
ncbi:IS2 transposase TnpB [Variovorax paradoxus]|uniref:IS2 transposase TnpB n=1 Tax=Variovorax paradoxus TaxID=34073 RepID=A0A0H2M991_VARPD|nr:IS2 transposase TnpB [Variovorax paradoxus]